MRLRFLPARFLPATSQSKGFFVDFRGVSKVATCGRWGSGFLWFVACVGFDGCRRRCCVGGLVASGAARCLLPLMSPGPGPAGRELLLESRSAGIAPRRLKVHGRRTKDQQEAKIQGGGDMRELKPKLKRGRRAWRDERFQGCRCLADLSVRVAASLLPLPRNRRRAKKNPAAAGFQMHNRVDHPTGVILEAWAPFGPWVTS